METTEHNNPPNDERYIAKFLNYIQLGYINSDTTEDDIREMRWDGKTNDVVRRFKEWKISENMKKSSS